MTDDLIQDFLAGVTLTSKRSLVTGKLMSVTNKYALSIDEWPKEIVVLGTTYTLECITVDGDGHERATYG